MTRLEELAEALRAAKAESDKRNNERSHAEIVLREAGRLATNAADIYTEARGRLVHFAEELGSGRTE